MDSEPDRVEIGNIYGSKLGTGFGGFEIRMNFIDYGVPISEINQENEESDEKQVRVSPLE